MTEDLVVAATAALPLPLTERIRLLEEMRDWLAIRGEYGSDPTPASEQAAAEAGRRREDGDVSWPAWAACAEALRLREASAVLETELGAELEQHLTEQPIEETQ